MRVSRRCERERPQGGRVEEGGGARWAVAWAVVQGGRARRDAGRGVGQERDERVEREPQQAGRLGRRGARARAQCRIGPGRARGSRCGRGPGRQAARRRGRDRRRLLLANGAGFLADGGLVGDRNRARGHRRGDRGDGPDSGFGDGLVAAWKSDLIKARFFAQNIDDDVHPLFLGEHVLPSGHIPKAIGDPVINESRLIASGF